MAWRHIPGRGLIDMARLQGPETYQHTVFDAMMVHVQYVMVSRRNKYGYQTAKLGTVVKNKSYSRAQYIILRLLEREGRLTDQQKRTLARIRAIIAG